MGPTRPQASRSLGAILALILLPSACGDGARSEASGDDPSPGGAISSPEDVPRTADPTARGLTDADFPRLQELAQGVYSYEALRSAGEESFTTVSMFVVTDEGVVVADGQGSVEETARLVEAIGSVTERPITHVIIASDHGDHTAGNTAFPEDAEFIAHPTSAAALRTQADNPNRAADAPPVVMPDRLVEERAVLELGGRSIEVLHLGRAHTGGDLVVYLPVEKIMFMSETFLNRVFPAMRSAFPSEWVEMLRRAQAMDVDVFVPGHGFVEMPEVLEEELEMYLRALEQVIGEGRRLHAQGLPVEEAIEQADFGELETWSLRASQGPTALRRTYMELDGELPGGGM